MYNSKYVLNILSSSARFAFYFLFQEALLNISGFKELFGRFLEETGPSVQWERIKPPPEGSVSNFI